LRAFLGVLIQKNVEYFPEFSIDLGTHVGA
jgi:hypothetical protein